MSVVFLAIEARPFIKQPTSKSHTSIYTHTRVTMQETHGLKNTLQLQTSENVCVYAIVLLFFCIVQYRQQRVNSAQITNVFVIYE